ncbi:MAG: histidine kinase [Saprospiraceae bacterium]|nr:histidine kinase [Saprospiraceae bacterium]
MNVLLGQKDYKLQTALHIVIWLGAALTHGLLFIKLYPYEVAMFRGFLNTFLMAVIFYLNFYLVQWFAFRKQYLIYFAILIPFAWLVITGRVYVNLQFPSIDWQKYVNDERLRWQVGAVTTSISVWAISSVYTIFHRRMYMEAQQKEMTNRQNEAQLQFLRAQINPHFLFNTLNNIYSLAIVQSEKTADMVLKLSNLLRYVIYEGREEKVSLSAEAQQIQEYIELFQMRSEFPLDIQFEQQLHANDIQLEPMILIPIVENCFKHCDFDTNPNAFVKIHLDASPQQLTLVTRNSKSDANQQKDKVGGVGLENIKTRLELRYPNRHQLNIQNLEDCFEVHLQIQCS